MLFYWQFVRVASYTHNTCPGLGIKWVLREGNSFFIMPNQNHELYYSNLNCYLNCFHISWNKWNFRGKLIFIWWKYYWIFFRLYEKLSYVMIFLFLSYKRRLSHLSSAKSSKYGNRISFFSPTILRQVPTAEQQEQEMCRGCRKDSAESSNKNNLRINERDFWTEVVFCFWTVNTKL